MAILTLTAPGRAVRPAGEETLRPPWPQGAALPAEARHAQPPTRTLSRQPGPVRQGPTTAEERQKPGRRSDDGGLPARRDHVLATETRLPRLPVSSTSPACDDPVSPPSPHPGPQALAAGVKSVVRPVGVDASWICPGSRSGTAVGHRPWRDHRAPQSAPESPGVTVDHNGARPPPPLTGESARFRGSHRPGGRLNGRSWSTVTLSRHAAADHLPASAPAASRSTRRACRRHTGCRLP